MVFISEWGFLSWWFVVAFHCGVGAFYPSAFAVGAFVCAASFFSAPGASFSICGFLPFVVGASGFGALAAVGDGAGCEALVFGAAAWVGLAGGVSRR